MSDDEVQQVIDYHNNGTYIPTDTTSSDSCMYDYGALLYMSAIPDADFAFDRWSDGNTDNPRAIIVTTDAEYTALFVVDTGTAIDNSSAMHGGYRKLLHNGQIFILRGDKTYILQGQEVK